MSARDAQSLGVIILSYGDGGESLGLIESLLSEDIQMGVVVLVHNPSRPGEEPPTVPDGVRIIQASHNLGYAGGMNLGLEDQLASNVDLILALTHDARLRTGAVAALLCAAAENPRFGVLGPALVWTGTDVAFSFGGRTRSNGSVTHTRESPPSEPGQILVRDWIDGGTLLVRADAIRRVGGFDERFWGYGEETELCLRVIRAGYAVGVVPGAVAEQAPGGKKRLGAWSYLITRNGLEYARRATGNRGALELTGRSLKLASIGVVRAVLRKSRIRRGDPMIPWTESVGSLRGIFDFYRRRWGPPPKLPGMGDVQNTAPPGATGQGAAVLHLGPDIGIGGGMAAAQRALMQSPLADRWQLEMLGTYRGPEPLSRLAVFARALAKLLAWRLRGRGRIVHIHSTVRGSMTRKAICVLVAKGIGMRVVLQVHSGPGDIAEFTAGLSGPQRVLYRLAFRRADVTLAVSAASAEAIGSGYGAKGVLVVPNAAPPVEVRDRDGSRLRSTVDLLYLGGFANRAKGGDILLEAVGLIRAEPPLRLLLAGPGELPPLPRPTAGVEIEWLGWLGDDNRDAAIRDADGFILASRSEGLPMAVLEAMSSGLPIVATSVGGVPEVLDDEVDALLVAPGDPAELAAAISRVASDSKLRERLGRSARERAVKLDGSAVADRIEEIYTSLIE